MGCKVIRMDDANIEALLNAVERGESEAVDALFAAVYEDLRRIARAQRRKRGGGETMSTTALVHEAYLRIAKRKELTWENRVHFFATAAKVIRHVLASYGRHKRSAKRGGGSTPLPFDELLFVTDSSVEQALSIHQAIARLEGREPRQGKVLECRIFGGMTVPETARALSISAATVKRDWTMATLWLYEELGLTVGTPLAGADAISAKKKGHL